MPRRPTPSGAEDSFTAAYTAVVKRDPQALARRPRARAVAARVRAAPAEPVALRGTVLTPDGASSGYVVVGGGTQIADVVTRKPQGVRVHDTNDAVICPGLIDLHGHPEFNVFAAWEPPRRYINRYQWREREPLYDALVKQPIKRLRAALEPKTLLRYAEIRALVAGVTAIQGTGGTIQPHEEESLVRNVDRIIFDDQVGTSMLDLPSKTGRAREDLDDILADITAGHVKAFYLHLAEGQPDNKASTAEFDRMVDLHALTAATVIIHGTALTEDQLADLRDAGASLVWSPQSNLRLYATTTKADRALQLGLKLALGADWLPTGSINLLAEMKVARHWLATRGADIGARKLVDMVTRDAATIAGLQDKLGMLRKDRPADLVIFERRHEDPYETVAQADAGAVELVMIDGDIPYGRADWIESLTDHAHTEHLEELPAWGKRMLLDTSYAIRPAGTPPTLAQLRARLITEYPQVGPIFA